MPLISHTFQVPDGGGSTATYGSIAVQGLLTAATLGSVDAGVPQTFGRITIFEPVNPRGIDLVRGWPSKYNANIPLSWTGNIIIPRDYSYYVYAYVRNLTGIEQKWQLDAIFEEDYHRGRPDRPHVVGV